MSHKNSTFRNLAMVSQLGLSVIVPILLCIWVGTFLDNRLDSNLTFPLLILGFLSGGRNGYVLAKRMIEPEEDKDSGTGD